MAEGAVWQPNYVDLSDDRTVRFGADCVVCGARYVTVPVSLIAPLPLDGEPDPATAQAIDEQKYQFFNEFDSAFRSITIACFRCGQPACPDCWDVDKQMCGSCVAERNLIRSPHRGEPVDGPLAQGFLRRIEPGRYSEVGRPTWLKELLRAQSDPDAARMVGLMTPPPAGSPAQAAPPPSFPPPALDVTETGYLHPPALNMDHPSFEPPPTHKMEANAPTPRPAPTPAVDPLNGPEGTATSGFMQCPRCGEANYDFVTQCSGCGLQLIQICPVCERLNPGHAERCQSCDAPLERPRGWSGVNRPIVSMEPQQARRRISGRPATPPIAPAPQVRQPLAWDDDPTPDIAHIPPFQSFEAPVLVGGYSQPRMASAVAVAPRPDGRHPYESTGPAMRPDMLYDGSEAAPSWRAQAATTITAILERMMTLGLIAVLFVVVGAVAASEASPQANHTLSAILHFDIKSHVDLLLNLLQIHLPK